LHAVLVAIGWHQSRLLEVIPIRPPQPLARGAFSGFFDRSLRNDYIEDGRKAARAALRHLVPLLR
jgi:hypothetical protein